VAKSAVSLTAAASIADHSSEEQIEQLTRNRDAAKAARARDERANLLASLSRAVEQQQAGTEKLLGRLLRQTPKLGEKQAKDGLKVLKKLQELARKMEMYTAHYQAVLRDSI
jgi:hypothetical protein